MGLRERKEAQTRETIFRIAMRKFCEESIEGTTFKEIAEEAEIAERTLYRYFPTKEDLATELYIANLRILNDDSVFKDLITVRNTKSFFSNLESFKKEVIDGIKNIPDRLHYDLLFNVYSARRHEDPSEHRSHFMQRDWYKEASESWGDDGVLIYELVSMLLGYTQRLIMLEYQKSVPDWEVAIRRFESVFDCSTKGFSEQLDFIKGTVRNEVPEGEEHETAED